MEDLTTLSSDKHSPEHFQINMRQWDYYMMMQKLKNDALWCKSAKNLAICLIYEASINLWCDLTTLALLQISIFGRLGSYIHIIFWQVSVAQFVKSTLMSVSQIHAPMMAPVKIRSMATFVSAKQDSGVSIVRSTSMSVTLILVKIMPPALILRTDMSANVWKDSKVDKVLY